MQESVLDTTMLLNVYIEMVLILWTVCKDSYVEFMKSTDLSMLCFTPKQRQRQNKSKMGYATFDMQVKYLSLGHLNHLNHYVIISFC